MAPIAGGVHNMFATDDHLFALARGDKYVIIDVRDIYDPKRPHGGRVGQPPISSSSVATLPFAPQRASVTSSGSSPRPHVASESAVTS